MDTYLQIAAHILETERRPLSPRAILDIAYKKSIVPTHLHGKTQHKTLQARISEDIIDRREHSHFFRTRPGKFFLRKFLADENLPEEFRTIFPARRRFRELVKGPALAIPKPVLSEIASKDVPIQPDVILAAINADRGCYGDPKRRESNLVFLRSFVCVYRGRKLLSYRVGRYRDDRDNFMSKRSIGFSAFVGLEDQTLFNMSTMGIVDSGVRAAKIDLDIPEILSNDPVKADLGCFLWSEQSAADLLAVVSFECPKWFEPLKRRLALNDLCWLDVSAPVNDIDDFDPWSKSILLAYFNTHSSRALSGDADYPSFGFGRRGVSKVSDRDWRSNSDQESSPRDL